MFRQKYTKDGNLFSPAWRALPKAVFWKYSKLLHLTTFKQHLITQSNTYTLCLRARYL